MPTRAFAFPVLLLGLSACASFESGELSLLDRWPPATVAAPKPLELRLEGVPEKFDAGWQEQALKVFEESGRFGTVTTGSAETIATSPSNGHRLRILVEHSRPEIVVTRTFMYLCAFTAGIVPARAAHTFDVQAIVLDSSGNPIGTTTRSVTSATWVGWVVLPALPFAGIGMSGMIRDTMRSILLECVEEGWL